MNTLATVNEVMLLPDGSAAIRVTITKGPQVEIGQVGQSTLGAPKVTARVIGVGAVDPNLDSAGRQGLLVRVVEGDASSLKGATLGFEAAI